MPSAQKDIAVGVSATSICGFEQADFEQQAGEAALVISGDMP